MNKLLLPGLLLIIASALQAQSTPLSSDLFIQQDKETETYQCIQIRRGDIITLTGSIEFINDKTELDQKNLYFTSLGGRGFILKGDLLGEITIFSQSLKETERITIKGTVLFEGLEERPAELEVSRFSPSITN